MEAGAAATRGRGLVGFADDGVDILVAEAEGEGADLAEVIGVLLAPVAETAGFIGVDAPGLLGASADVAADRVGAETELDREFDCDEDCDAAGEELTFAPVEAVALDEADTEPDRDPGCDGDCETEGDVLRVYGDTMELIEKFDYFGDFIEALL